VLITKLGKCPCCNQNISFMVRMSFNENIVCQNCGSHLSRSLYKKYFDVIILSLFGYFVIWNQDYLGELLNNSDDRWIEIPGIALLLIFYLINSYIFGFCCKKVSNS
jgi:hypothetical protein